MANLQIVPATKNVEAQYVEMRVPLYSHGCERKVKKALAQIKGIYSVSVDFYQQKVTVWGICNKYDVLETMRSKRKDARFWNVEDNVEVVMEESKSESKASPILSSLPSKVYKTRPSFTLTEGRSLKWKLSLKKVFTRSYSF